ncbi:hypothetical protein [Nocardia fluminea]|uniref:hypothetical protein n=1 Tax=Nocardia fluminea TaxID=134984 RepID=UPI003D0EE379
MPPNSFGSNSPTARNSRPPERWNSISAEQITAHIPTIMSGDIDDLEAAANSFR